MYNKANVYGTKHGEQERRENTNLSYEVMISIYRHYLYKADQYTG